MATTMPRVEIAPLRLSGRLQGVAFHAAGMPRRERQRVQSGDERLVQAIRRRVIPEELRDAAFAYRDTPNVISTTGKNYIVSSWLNTTELELMKFHGNGSGTTAPDAGGADTALQIEYQAQLNPVNTRGFVSASIGGSAKIFRTIGTNLFQQASLSVTEWGLFNTSTVLTGVMFSRVTFSAIAIGIGDSIQWTYECTVG
jgi:hypothetical protein